MLYYVIGNGAINLAFEKVLVSYPHSTYTHVLVGCVQGTAQDWISQNNVRFHYKSNQRTNGKEGV